MKLSMKKALLTGTAIFAASTFAAGAQAATYSTTQTIAGGTGTTGAGAVDATGTAGGDAIVFGANNITLTTSGTTTGGTGQAGPVDTDNSNANLGGAGGKGVNFNAESGTAPLPSLVVGGPIIGGTGGQGGTPGGTAPSPNGAAGGAGGDGVFDNANNSSITGTGGTAAITGGNGGLGGTAGVAGIGGTGGAGAIGLEITGTGVTYNVTGNVTGGSGGQGGASAVAAVRGTGGAAAAAVRVSGINSTLTFGTGSIITAGTGGAIGAVGTGGGAVGAGANAVDIAATGATITNHGTINGQAFHGLDLSANTTSITNSGLIEAGAGGVALYNNGVLGTLTNTGTINGGTGVAVQQTKLISNFVNTGGTITSANVTVGQGTLDVTADLGADETLSTGTISNTAAGGNVIVIGSAQTGTIINNGAVTAATGGNAVLFNFAGAQAFSNGAGGVLTGNVSDGGVASIATLGNAGTITGNIGLTGAAAHTVTLTGGNVTGTYTGGSAVDTLNFNGGTLAGAIDLAAGANILNINQNTTTTANIGATGGTIAATVASGKVFTIANTANFGNATFNDIGTTTVNAGGILTQSGTANIGGILNDNVTGSTLGAVVNTGTIHLAPTVNLAVTSYGPSSTGVYEVDLSSDGTTNTTGKITASVGAVDLSGGTVNVHTLTSTVAPGSSSIIATGAVAETNADRPVSVTDNSFFYNFTVTPGTGLTADDLLLNPVASQSIADATDSQNNANAATALFTGSNAQSTNPQIIALQNALANDSSRAGFNRDVQSLEPNVDGGAAQGAIDATDTSFDLTEQQLAMLNSGDASTGMAAGNNAYGMRTWAEGFGGHANQDSHDGQAGYDSNTAGGAVGMDSQGDNSILGLALSYGHTHVDTDLSNKEQVNSYQATLYGDQYLTSIDKDVFVTGMAAFQYGRNNESRNDIGGITNLDADGNYNSYEGAGRVVLGKDFRLHGMTLTPTLLSDYTYYRSDSYEESGAGGADLHVSSNSENIWNVGIGTKATWLFKNTNGSYFKPDVHVGYKYDVLHDDQVDVTSNFAGGGPAFSTKGVNPSNHTANAGVDLRFYAVNRWELTGSYDFTWKPQYTDNTGLIRASYRF